MLRFVRLGKEMIEREICAQQCWRFFNATARNYESFDVTPSSLSCTYSGGCIGQGSLVLLPRPSPGSSGWLLLETSWEAAGLRGWLGMSVL